MSDADTTPPSDTEETGASGADTTKAKRNGVAAQPETRPSAKPSGDAATDDQAAVPASAEAERAGSAAQRAGVAAQRASEVLTDVAGDVAQTVSKKAPAIIDASRTGAGIAAREVQGASSENLMLGTVFSTGLALGLMLARVPRPLSILALVPVFAMGGTLLGRRAGIGSASTRKTSASGRTKGGAS